MLVYTYILNGICVLYTVIEFVVRATSVEHTHTQSKLVFRVRKREWKRRKTDAEEERASERASICKSTSNENDFGW